MHSLLLFQLSVSLNHFGARAHIHLYQTIILKCEAKIKSLCADINNLTAFLCNGNHLAIQSLRRHSSFAESIKKPKHTVCHTDGLKFLK